MVLSAVLGPPSLPSPNMTYGCVPDDVDLPSRLLKNVVR